MRLAVVAAAAVLAAAFAASPAAALVQGTDYSGPAWNILAPGAEGGLVAGPFSTDQAALYDKLTPVRQSIGELTLEKDYLPEKFGVQGSILREETEGETGRAGLTIQRDSHDIPHIYGTTRGAAMWGSGWVAAKDRGLLLDLGLGPAFVAAVGAPGVNPFGLLLNRRSFTPSFQTFVYVAEQEKVLLEAGPEGERVISDLEEWCEGVNAYEEKFVPEKFRLPHITVPFAIAGFAFIGSIFGNGGGNEVTNSNLLAHLEAGFGEEEGLKIYHDLRESNDPEAPVTTTTSFPYDAEPSGSAPGAAVIDPNSFSPAAAKAAKVLTASRRKMSNFLLAGSSLTRTGHPDAVMGPQLGYFYPEIVFQADMHAPGLDAQGIVAPISPYVFIGRGQDFAWSLTSAGSENTQQFLEKLCVPGGGTPTPTTRFYEYKGECKEMSFFDAGKLGEGEGEPERELTFYESVHGPISGTVTVKGQLYAIANARTTRGREPAGELAFSKLDSNEVHSPEEFFEAANKLETTFNMAYVDSKHIAFFSTGRLPKLAAGTNPSLPTLGEGNYDWQGFLDQEEHPHAIDPVGGTLLNWNNKPAPGWGAASDNYFEGPVHRVQMYTGFHTKLKLPQVAGIMNRAATEDLRGLEDWPVVRKLIEPGPAPNALYTEAVNMVNAWTEAGSSRLGNKFPKAAAAAVMDAVYPRIAEAIFRPVLGPTGVAEFASLFPPEANAPSSQGSAFGGGWEGYVQKTLREIQGESVAQPYSRLYCGGGSLTTCRENVIQAINEGVEELKNTQGSTPTAWKAAAVRISFAPGILSGTTMRWTNRSTFQQVIEFTGHNEVP